MPTRAQLRTSTRVMADQDNSTFPTDTAVNDFLDRAARTVWRRCLAVGWKPDRTSVTTTITPGTSQYTIGSDVSVIHSVMFITGGVRYPLTRVKPEQLADLLIQPTAIPLCYDILNLGTTAAVIELYPTPSSGQIDIRYTKRFPGFTADGDIWIGPDGSEELIIITAAIDCANKEGDPGDMVRALNERLKMRWDEVIEAAGWMDSQGQQTVKDTKRAVIWRPGDYMVSEGWE